jgi:hypothetical protein
VYLNAECLFLFKPIEGTESELIVQNRANDDLDRKTATVTDAGAALVVEMIDEAQNHPEEESRVCIGMFLHQVSSILLHYNTKRCRQQDKFRQTSLLILHKPQFLL